MNDERPTEPAPRSFRPAWIYLGLMAALTAAIGLAAAVVALMVR